MSAHGTITRYGDGCSCPRCRKAIREYQRAWRARIRRTDPATWAHGEGRTYKSYGCRCLACTEAHRLACWDYRERARART